MIHSLLWVGINWLLNHPVPFFSHFLLIFNAFQIFRNSKILGLYRISWHNLILTTLLCVIMISYHAILVHCKTTALIHKKFPKHFFIWPFSAELANISVCLGIKIHTKYSKLTIISYSQVKTRIYILLTVWTKKMKLIPHSLSTVSSVWQVISPFCMGPQDLSSIGAVYNNEHLRACTSVMIIDVIIPFAQSNIHDLCMFHHLQVNYELTMWPASSWLLAQLVERIAPVS